MSSETEMRNLMLHAAAKLDRVQTRELTGEHNYNHGYALPADALVAMSYAEGILRLLASYLKVEEAPAPPRVLERPKPAGRPDAPRNEHGQFVKESA
jgi:hypothetical protein